MTLSFWITLSINALTMKYDFTGSENGFILLKRDELIVGGLRSDGDYKDLGIYELDILWTPILWSLSYDKFIIIII